jgi:hypothetical protein
MSVTYQRAILMAIMRTVAVNPNIAVKSLEVPSEGGRGAYEAYTVHREVEARTLFTADDQRDVEELKAISALNQLSHERIIEICKVGERSCLRSSAIVLSTF